MKKIIALVLVSFIAIASVFAGGGGEDNNCARQHSSDSKEPVATALPPKCSQQRGDGCPERPGGNWMTKSPLAA